MDRWTIDGVNTGLAVAVGRPRVQEQPAPKSGSGQEVGMQSLQTKVATAVDDDR